MTAAGEAVLAVAYGEVGYVEGANNSTKYWDWYGGNYGPWCGVFCMWCSDQAGYPVCTDTVLVSNGTLHGYTTGGSGATGVEAQRTLDLQPGDFVLFSWEPWEFRDGVPTCVGEWDGYPAGDHIGIFAYDLGGGRFAAVEGNTSDGSWDNGGMVLLREDRYHSQVCGWWRQERIAGGSAGGDDEMTEADFARIQGIVHDEVLNVWRAQEMANLDSERAQVGGHAASLSVLRSEEANSIETARAEQGAHNATLGIVRSEEYGAIVEGACRRAMGGQ
jgi:hypothetical protein